MAALQRNSLLQALKIRASDSIILVNEWGIADSNFILTHIMKQVFQKSDNGLCLVILHNTLGHYQNVGKTLGYDFLKKVEDGSAVAVEPLKSVWELFDAENELPLNFYTADKEQICKHMLGVISIKLNNLLKQKSGQIYLLIDDLSHLLDMAVDTRHVLGLINCCINLNERVTFVANTHVSGQDEDVISNAVTYNADVIVDVKPLKTGRSRDVSGIITVRRPQTCGKEERIYHYKTLPREIKTFLPGNFRTYY